MQSARRPVGRCWSVAPSDEASLSRGLAPSIDHVQFCSGLAAMRPSGGSLMLTYGVGDCAAFGLVLPVSELRELWRVSRGATSPTKTLGRSEELDLRISFAPIDRRDRAALHRVAMEVGPPSRWPVERARVPRA